MKPKSSKTKAVTQYARLLEAVRDFRFRVLFPKQRRMWYFQKEKMDQAWLLKDLAERVRAADQLGYDVKLSWADNLGLVVTYLERSGDIDYPI